MRATIILVADVDDLAAFEGALAPELDAAAERIAGALGVDVDDVGYESITVDDVDTDELELEGDDELEDEEG